MELRDVKEALHKLVQEALGEPIEVDVPININFHFVTRHPVTGERVPVEVEGAKKEEKEKPEEKEE